MPSPRPRLAPVLDAACLVAFVAAGRDSHGIHQGAGWFLTVLWPLSLGWFGMALATRLYTRRAGSWSALAVTLLGGVAIDAVCRGTFTGRPYLSVFTVIAVAFLGLTTFGWRAVGVVVTRRRGAPRPG